MAKDLKELKSFINNYTDAKDKNNAFTFIEFIKEFGFENNSSVFIGEYKDYLSLWSNKKKTMITLNDEDFVMSKMVDILKSITLDYSSYEEQDYLSSIDWTDKNEIKKLIPYYTRKIREISEFYRRKRNNTHLVVKRNSMKGSTRSLEEIVYNKIIDFIFNNRNIVPSYLNIKRDLIVSIENYVDTYSEYFDIPRNKDFVDKSREEMLTANMNDVDYRNYLEISVVVSEILFSGNVYLEEIPLIAQLGMDLSQSCVGDMLTLRNKLVANTTINRIPLNEQVALKRKLYEKYLGCDLYYLYVDVNKDIKMDILCKAKNPTGNLLNCGSADTATIESNQLELLSHIGLFFKPDKTSILKVSAKKYSWTIDEDKLEEDTMYIFPDPAKYGDIGNNKSDAYPLIMEYKMDYDIRNLSSGNALNDPLMFITDQGWRTYYSKQDDDFRIIDNTNYDYAFTSLANNGIMETYQVDAWGNQFGIFKGIEFEYKKENNTIVNDENGNPIVEKIIVPEKFYQNVNEVSNMYDKSRPMIINGGYFENPNYKGQRFTSEKYYYSDKTTNADKKTIKVRAVKIGNKIVMMKSAAINDLPSNVTVNYHIPKELSNNSDCIKKGYYELTSYKRKYVSKDEIDFMLNYSSVLSKHYSKQKKTVYSYDYLKKGNGGVPFDYTVKETINDNYHWSGLHVHNDSFYIPSLINNFINYGEFTTDKKSQYIDNYGTVGAGYIESTDASKDDTIDILLKPYLSSLVMTDGSDGGVKIETKDIDFDTIKNSYGTLYVRNCNDIHNRPQKFNEVFGWCKIDSTKIKNIQIIFDIMLVETEDKLLFIKYAYDGTSFSNPLVNKEMITLDKSFYKSTSYTYVEGENCFYVCQLEYSQIDNAIIPHIYKFNCYNYTIKEIINPYDVINRETYEANNLDKEKTWVGYVTLKRSLNQNVSSVIKSELLNGKNEKYPNFGDFKILYYPNINLGNVVFNYNSSLGLFNITFIILDLNGSPFFYDFKFKALNNDVMNETLISNVYMIGDSDIETRYAASLTSKSYTYPNESITSAIFTKV